MQLNFGVWEVVNCKDRWSPNHVVGGVYTSGRRPGVMGVGGIMSILIVEWCFSFVSGAEERCKGVGRICRLTVCDTLPEKQDGSWRERDVIGKFGALLDSLRRLLRWEWIGIITVSVRFEWLLAGTRVNCYHLRLQHDWGYSLRRDSNASPDRRASWSLLTDLSTSVSNCFSFFFWRIRISL